MNPLLTLSAGMLAGVVAVRWLKSDKTKAGLDRAQERLRHAATGGLDTAQHTLRDAAIAGLSAVETSSARLRGKLTPASAAAAAETAPMSEAAPIAATAPIAEPATLAAAAPAKKAAVRRAPRKKAAAKTVKTSGDQS